MLSKGTKLMVTIGSTPTAIPGIADLDTPNATRAEIKTTDLDSDAEEYELDIPDNGELSFTTNLKDPDTGHDWEETQAHLETAYHDNTLEVFSIQFPGSRPKYGFSAYVKQFKPTAGVGKVLQAAITLRISGAVTKTVTGS